MIALLLAVACDPALWGHVYHPSRLVIVERCKSFAGTIVSERPEKDGDIHVQVRLDPGQGKPLNHANVARQNGTLVVEPICEKTPVQKDAIGPCKGARAVPVPKVGAHVMVTGVYILDNSPGHGWVELHPVSKFEVIP